MDATEVKNMVLGSHEVIKRMDEWHAARLSEIERRASHPRLRSRPFGHICLLPVASFLRRIDIPPGRLKTLEEHIRPISFAGLNPRITLDGYVSWEGNDILEAFQFARAWRTGQIEMATTGWVDTSKDPHEIVMRKILTECAKWIGQTLSLLQKLNVPPPSVVRVALSGVEGALLRQPADGFNAPEPIDRSLLDLPEAFVNDFSDSVANMLAPMELGLFNAAGLAGQSY